MENETALSDAQVRLRNSPLTKTLEQYWLDQKAMLNNSEAESEREAHDLRSNCEDAIK